MLAFVAILKMVDLPNDPSLAAVTGTLLFLTP
jgi:hypothetical protein